MLGAELVGHVLGCYRLAPHLFASIVSTLLNCAANAVLARRRGAAG